MNSSVLVFGAKQIVQVVSNRERFVRGEALKRISVLEENIDNGSLMIVILKYEINFHVVLICVCYCFFYLKWDNKIRGI